MELLLWIEQLYLWRLQRAYGTPKQEDPGQSEDEELPVASYPVVKQPLIASWLIESSAPNL